jgi:hypothetical protein
MPSPRDPTPPTGRSLSDRVQEQVDAATSKHPLAKRPRRRVNKLAQASAGDSADELRALNRVFREMGRSQRAARLQTGSPPSPIVRDAARAYRRAPSFTALVTVAASLDEVGLLSW